MRFQAALLALSVAVTALIAASHDHVPARPGLYDAAPRETSLHGDGLSICSICRLAHETSSGPVSPSRVAQALPRQAVRVHPRSGLTQAAPPRHEHPRGPPVLEMC